MIGIRQSHNIMSLIEKFQNSLSCFPCVAVLRGLEPESVVEIGDVLIAAGFTIIEVPLNSPNALKTIETLANAFGKEVIVGAGTVLAASAVADVNNAGGEIIVSPNMNSNVIKETKAMGLLSIPGAQTPTEVLAGIDAGADVLKIFPAEAVTPAVFKSIKAVLPPTFPTLIAGGVSPELMKDYLSNGASGCLIGSNLFRIGDGVMDVKEKSRRIKDEFLRLNII